MAVSNYKLCEVCKCKTFYDAMVDYPDNVLVMALCSACSETHIMKIEEIKDGSDS